MHLRSVGGGISGGQGESLDDDVCGRRSLLKDILYQYLTRVVDNAGENLISLGWHRRVIWGISFLKAMLGISNTMVRLLPAGCSKSVSSISFPKRKIKVDGGADAVGRPFGGMVAGNAMEVLLPLVLELKSHGDVLRSEVRVDVPIQLVRLLSSAISGAAVQLMF